jgi:hypothetical protein
MTIRFGFAAGGGTYCRGVVAGVRAELALAGWRNGASICQEGAAEDV